MRREGDEILADYRGGIEGAIAFVTLRLGDGATLDDIRHWYNIPTKKRDKILNVRIARSLMFVMAKDKWGDERRAVAYVHSRVPNLSDISIHAPAPDLSDPDRPLFCCLQPRVDRWLHTMHLRPCTDDELDQRLVAKGHKSVNSLIRAEIAAGNL